MKHLAAVSAIALSLLVPSFAPQAIAEDLTKVKIGALRLGGVAPLFVAINKGYFREQGLDPEFVEFTGSTQLPPAVTSRSIDVALVAYSAAFFNLAGKGQLKVIASQSKEKAGYHVTGYLVSNQAWDGGLKSFKDLNNKRVGVTGIGSSVQYALERVIIKYGIDRSTVQILPLQSVPNVLAAVQGGQADMGILTAIAIQPVEDQGRGHILGWQGDEAPAEYGGIVTTSQMIKEHRDTLQKVVTGFQKATREFNAAFNQLDSNGKPVKGPGYDELLTMLAQVFNQPAEAVAKSLPYVDPDARIDVQDMYDQLALWKKLGLADKDADPKNMLDLSFVKGNYNIPK